MTKKMAAEILLEFRTSYFEAYKGIFSDEVLKEGNPWFEAFLLSAMKAAAEEMMVEEKNPTKIGLDRYYLHTWEESRQDQLRRYKTFFGEDV